VILSDKDPNLFSEVQLAQIATMMPHLVSKQKARAADGASSAHSPLAPISESANSSSLETQKGLLRLAEFLKKQKKEPEVQEEQPSLRPSKDRLNDRAKVIPFRRISGPSLSQFMVRRGLQTYQWVTAACQASDATAVQINKYF
jgi:hypothetical protein